MSNARVLAVVVVLIACVGIRFFFVTRTKFISGVRVVGVRVEPAEGELAARGLKRDCLCISLDVPGGLGRWGEGQSVAAVLRVGGGDVWGALWANGRPVEELAVDALGLVTRYDLMLPLDLIRDMRDSLGQNVSGMLRSGARCGLEILVVGIPWPAARSEFVDVAEFRGQMIKLL